MSKLAWVVLPLAAAVAWLAVLVWRGRWPSRRIGDSNTPQSLPTRQRQAMTGRLRQ